MVFWVHTSDDAMAATYCWKMVRDCCFGELEQRFHLPGVHVSVQVVWEDHVAGHRCGSDRPCCARC